MTKPISTFLIQETFTLEQIKKARKNDPKNKNIKKSVKKSGRI